MGSSLYVANTGDSRALLGMRQGPYAVPRALSEEHTARNPKQHPPNTHLCLQCTHVYV